MHAFGRAQTALQKCLGTILMEQGMSWLWDRPAHLLIRAITVLPDRACADEHISAAKRERGTVSLGGQSLLPLSCPCMPSLASKQPPHTDQGDLRCQPTRSHPRVVHPHSQGHSPFRFPCWEQTAEEKGMHTADLQQVKTFSFPPCPALPTLTLK